MNILLEPGLAFGTGAHPTTRLCLGWLRGVVRVGDRVLDYGCGSGVLAIGARLVSERGGMCARSDDGWGMGGGEGLQGSCYHWKGD